MTEPILSTQTIMALNKPEDFPEWIADIKAYADSYNVWKYCRPNNPEILKRKLSNDIVSKQSIKSILMSRDREALPMVIINGISTQTPLDPTEYDFIEKNWRNSSYTERIGMLKNLNEDLDEKSDYIQKVKRRIRDTVSRSYKLYFINYENPSFMLRRLIEATNYNEHTLYMQVVEKVDKLSILAKTMDTEKWLEGWRQALFRMSHLEKQPYDEDFLTDRLVKGIKDIDPLWAQSEHKARQKKDYRQANGLYTTINNFETYMKTYSDPSSTESNVFSTQLKETDTPRYSNKRSKRCVWKHA